jgi:hypothetical protein
MQCLFDEILILPGIRRRCYRKTILLNNRDHQLTICTLLSEVIRKKKNKIYDTLQHKSPEQDLNLSRS